MKRILLLLICVLSISACISDNPSEEINFGENVGYLKYSVKEKYESNKLVYTQEYSFDEYGEVTSEKYTNYYNPQFSHFSTFEYNDNGQVVKELRDGEPYYSIVWTNDFAEIINSQDQKIAEFNFEGKKLSDYKTGFNLSRQLSGKFNYDSHRNIVSVEKDGEIVVEYLDYDLTKRNPLNLIESIGILRMDYQPFFKNIFGREKVYPFEGDDFSQPMTFYEYNYEFDSQDRVYRIEDEKSAIYISEFEYD